ncbi:MAG TPA: GntR family transcriptional regulator [Candidatus Binataceae bacterium]|nr:GntR family transcriptional regulator [Candidatus Binataceae bacterium]
MVATALAKHPARWYQIARDLQFEIAGRAAGGDLRLPTEAELAKKYGVSLLTLRQAMGFLAEKGLIDRKRKLGTFVRADAIIDKEILFLGSIRTVFAQQRSEKVRVLERRVVDTPPALIGPFGGERKVCKIVRLRYQRGRPTDLAINHLRRDVARGLDRRLLERLPITQAIHERGIAKIGYVRQELEAGISPDAARNLDMDPLSALMILTGFTYDDTDQLIDHARIMYRGDGVSFSLIYKA